MRHQIGIHVLTTPGTNSIRPTEKYSSQAALGPVDFSGLMSTSNLDKYADFIVTVISTAVGKAIPKSKSERFESNPISDETVALIKEKRRLRTRL